MTDLTKEESEKLIEAFNKLKLRPKADTAEDLKSWLKSYSEEGTVKAEPGTALGAASTHTVVSTSQQPRISLFYGDNVKGEATYSQWVYEVKCLLLEKTHKPEAIAQAIRRSLRGEASSIVRRLGVSASIIDILNKFDSVYGEVDTKEHLLAKFYSARQEDKEDVTKWSCRLEDILSSAVERKLVESSNVNEMLRNMFWQGLRPALKDISGYKFEKITDFDQLRVEIRKLEQDHFHTDISVPHCTIASSTNEGNSELKEMKTMIQSLTNTVKQLEKQVNSTQKVETKGKQSFSGNMGRGGNYTRGNYSGYSKNYQPNRNFSSPNMNNSPNIPFVQPNYRGNVRPQNNYSVPEQRQGQGQSFTYRTHNSNPRTNQPQSQRQETYEEFEDNFNRGPLCFRCRQYGHFQWDCPVRMDHSRKYLN